MAEAAARAEYREVITQVVARVAGMARQERRTGQAGDYREQALTLEVTEPKELAGKRRLRVIDQAELIPAIERKRFAFTGLKFHGSTGDLVLVQGGRMTVLPLESGGGKPVASSTASSGSGQGVARPQVPPVKNGVGANPAPRPSAKTGGAVRPGAPKPAVRPSRGETSLKRQAEAVRIAAEIAGIHHFSKGSIVSMALTLHIHVSRRGGDVNRLGTILKECVARVRREYEALEMNEEQIVKLADSLFMDVTSR